MQWLTELSAFLARSFTRTQLDRVVSAIDNDLLDEEAISGVARADYVFELCRALNRRGHLSGPFFSALLAARPQHSKRIMELAEAALPHEEHSSLSAILAPWVHKSGNRAPVGHTSPSLMLALAAALIVVAWLSFSAGRAFYDNDRCGEICSGVRDVGNALVLYRARLAASPVEHREPEYRNIRDMLRGLDMQCEE